MLISKELNAAINEEIGLELFASNQYLNMAAYLEGLPLKKLAAMFAKQADEERGHALKFVKYLNDVGGAVVIPAIDAPQPTMTVPVARPVGPVTVNVAAAAWSVRLPTLSSTLSGSTPRRSMLIMPMERLEPELPTTPAVYPVTAVRHVTTYTAKDP